MAKKFVKVGSVMARKDGNGVFIALGNERSKNTKYNFSVEVVVKDTSGKVLGTTKNGILSVQDPRKRPDITDEQLSRIPDSLKNELYLVMEE